MKYFKFARTHKLIAKFLLLEFLLQSCSPNYVGGPLDPRSAKVVHPSQWHSVDNQVEEGLALSTTTEPSFLHLGLSQGSDYPLSEHRFISHEGHFVRLIQDNGSWRAEVDENLPAGFSRKMCLPVCIDQAVSLARLCAYPESVQRRLITVSNLRAGKGCVCVGLRGLLGGSPEDNASISMKLTKLLSEIGELIDQQIPQNISNQDAIEQKLKVVKELINDKLELKSKDKAQVGYFRYLYHCRYAYYLRAMGKPDEASEHETTKDRYSEHAGYTSNIGASWASQGGALNDEETVARELDADNDDTKTREQHVSEIIEKIRELNFLEEPILVDISKIFQEFGSQLVDFSDYCRIIDLEITLKALTDEILIVLDDSSQEQGEKGDHDVNKGKAGEHVTHLRLVGQEMIYRSRLDFVQRTLARPDQVEHILFGGIIQTEESIAKHYRQLSCFFHPDTMARSFKPEDQSSLNELMAHINRCKESLMSKLPKQASEANGTPSYYGQEQKAKKHWDTSLDYRDAKNGNLEKLRVLAREDLVGCSPDRLIELKEEQSLSAYMFYRDCCRVADKNQDIKRQIDFRRYMALTLYAGNEKIMAQLCALAAIKLIHKNSNRVSCSDLITTEQILEKIQGKNNVSDKGNTGTTDSRPASSIVRTESSSSDLTVVKDAYSYHDRKKMAGIADEALDALSKKLVLKSDRLSIKSQATKEEIRRTRLNKCLAIGCYRLSTETVSIAGIGGIVGGVSLNAASQAASWGAAAGPIGGVIAGVATFSLGIWGTRGLIKSGYNLWNKSPIRRNIDEIIQQALNYYDDDPQEFIQTLSKEYDKDRKLLDGFPGELKLRQMISSLLNYGYRPDGIAHLLNLIGEALNSGKINWHQYTSADWFFKAKETFRSVSGNNELKRQAEELDKRITEWSERTKQNWCASLAGDSWDKLRGIFVTSEYVNDAQEMSFTARLEATRNTARMNLAIICIFNSKEKDDEIRFAEELIGEVHSSIRNSVQFSSESMRKLEIIEDFLWIVSGQPCNSHEWST